MDDNDRTAAIMAAAQSGALAEEFESPTALGVIGAARALVEGYDEEAQAPWAAHVKALEFALGQYDAARRAR